MPHILNIDIGTDYFYSSSVMNEHLSGLVKGDLNLGRSIPLGILSDAREIFYLTLRQIEHDKNPKNTPIPVMRARVLENLVMDILGLATGKPYTQHNSLDEFEKDARQCSKLLHELPHKIRYDESQYLTLQRFFEILSRKTDDWMDDPPSPYTAPLGW